MQIDLSIIIVNYNVKEFILNAIQSIYKAKNNLNIEIIVVDNNSSDGSPEIIKNTFPEVKVIPNKANLGFAKANNQGIKIAQGKYLLLLNPDTIVQEDTFTTLIDFLEKHPDAGMCGCKILNPDGSLQLACRRSYPSLWVAFTKITGLSNLFPKSKLFGKYNLTYLDENQTYEVDAISGSFMFLRKEVIDKVKGLDEDFFMYGEDLDFCYRIKQAGYKIYYVHNTSIIHYKGESTKRSNIDEIKHFYGAMQIFVKKHYKFNIILMMLVSLSIKLRSIFAFFYKHRSSVLQILLDNLAVTFSIYLAEQLYLVNKLGWNGFLPEAKPYIYIIPSILFNILAFVFGSYRFNKIYLSRKVIALILNFIFLSAFTFFFKEYGYSRAVTLLSFLFSAFVIVIYGIIFKLIYYQATPNFIKVAVIGTNETSLKLVDKLKKNIKHIYEIKGLIAIKTDEVDKNINGLRVVGSIDNIEKIISEFQIEKIVITPNLLSYEQILKLLTRCEGKVEFLLATNTLEYLVGKSNSQLDEDIELLKIDYAYLKLSNRIIKKIFEKSLLLILLLTFPLKYIVKNKFVERLYNNISALIEGKMQIVGFGSNSNGINFGKPGITGLWFINKHPNDENVLESYDIIYAKNYSVWFDLQILIKSFRIKH